MSDHKYGCDVLNLEWNSRGRDVDIVEPVLVHLELFYGCSVVRRSILDYYREIRKHRPKVLLISNQGGGSVNFRAARLAACLGVKVVSLVSEGDYPDHDSERTRSRFWGWNTDEVFYEHMHLEWSHRALKLVLESVPHSESFRMCVSGGTGFDRYVFDEYPSQASFLQRHELSGFQSVVGVAGWAFDRAVQVTGEDAERIEPEREFHRRALGLLREAYRIAIESLPHTLFVLKMHPGLVDEEWSEFCGLESYRNVCLVRGSSEQKQMR